MQIIDVQLTDDALIQQMAELLVEGFRDHWPDAWPELDDALDEVHEAIDPEKICRAALDDDGLTVLGWIGGQPEYDGNVWELHPMVVRQDTRKRGIGRALVAGLEVEAKARGGLMIHLGTDDEDDMTSLAGVDLYTDLWEKIKNIQNLKGHPYEFYQKCGYIITGVVPDANGPGKPDIIMSKKL